MGKELAKTYDPKGIEDRLYQKWLDKKYFRFGVSRVGNSLMSAIEGKEIKFF